MAVKSKPESSKIRYQLLLVAAYCSQSPVNKNSLAVKPAVGGNPVKEMMKMVVAIPKKGKILPKPLSDLMALEPVNSSATWIIKNKPKLLKSKMVV